MPPTKIQSEGKRYLNDFAFIRRRKYGTGCCEKLMDKRLQDSAILDQLIKLMVEEQEKSQRSEEEFAKIKAARDAQRERNTKDMECRLLLKQERCDHIKGSQKGRKKSLTDNLRRFWKEWLLSSFSNWRNWSVETVAMDKDYAISDHTFIDGSRIIKCQRCAKKWTKGGADWDLALEMVKSTTNGRTSSEQPRLRVEIGDQVVTELPHTTNSIEVLKNKYPSWDGIIKK